MKYKIIDIIHYTKCNYTLKPRYSITYLFKSNPFACNESTNIYPGVHPWYMPPFNKLTNN